MFDLTGKKVIIIGGSSGIGLGIAQACLEKGAKLIIASRNADKLARSRIELGKEVQTQQMDISKPEQIKTFFKKIGKFDHVVTPGATVSWGALGTISEQDEHNSFQSKFWGQYYVAKYGFSNISPNGSIVLFAGNWSQRPMAGAAIPGSINGAIESLGKALAVELAPVRVNVISPGIIDTPLFGNMPEAERKSFFKKNAMRLPVKKIGNPADVAMTAIYLMANHYTTGSTLYVDGGETLK
jgi:NAD(P)-dependent dehydrogenase (short-subunit alcohol dehydrogenase family)